MLLFCIWTQVSRFSDWNWGSWVQPDRLSWWHGLSINLGQIINAKASITTTFEIEQELMDAYMQNKRLIYSMYLTWWKNGLVWSWAMTRLQVQTAERCFYPPIMTQHDDAMSMPWQFSSLYDSEHPLLFTVLFNLNDGKARFIELSGVGFPKYNDLKWGCNKVWWIRQLKDILIIHHHVESIFQGKV